MFERLLELFFHLKTGAWTAVFVVGATGALVSATLTNGTTTITVNQESASPSVSPSASASASPTASASASPSASASASPSASPSSSPSASDSANGCSDWAHEREDAVKTVNDAYARLHSDLQKLRKDAKGEQARDVLDGASDELKEIRKDAVEAIHDSGKCEKDGDDDEDEDEDEDEDRDEEHASNGAGSTNFLVRFLSRLFGGNATVTVVTTSASPSATASPAPSATASPAPSATAAPSASPSASTAPVVTGEDPQAIADNAVAAMELVFNNAKAELEGLTPTTTERPDKSHERSDRDSKGKSAEHRGSDNDDDDDEDEEDDDD